MAVWWNSRHDKTTSKQCYLIAKYIRRETKIGKGNRQKMNDPTRMHRKCVEHWISSNVSASGGNE